MEELKEEFKERLEYVLQKENKLKFNTKELKENFCSKNISLQTITEEMGNNMNSYNKNITGILLKMFEEINVKKERKKNEIPYNIEIDYGKMKKFKKFQKQYNVYCVIKINKKSSLYNLQMKEIINHKIK